ncbi:MAG TPA: histidine kinase [Acidimicrobiia bacterium]|nr:histidine kinase [Acidimicrobiia bacterium]
MLANAAPWETRVHAIAVVGQWVALTIGVVSSLVSLGVNGLTLGAAAIASAYVIGSTWVPERWYRYRFGSDALPLFGAILILISMTMTGGTASPYLLLSMGPPIFATLYGGIRSGLTTAILSGSLLTLVTLARGQSVLDVAPAFALYLVFAVLVGAVRRLLEDMHAQTTSLRHEKESATQRLERLEEIHDSLLRLSEDVSSGRLNAVEVAADTLDTIMERFPGSAGKLAVVGESGDLVVLSARGIPEENGDVYELPLSTSDSDVGSLELTTAEPLGPAELAEVAAIIHPVSLAFANLRLLQDIVGSAVAEERARLAREMHDEIGPSLASLGLALDMTAMQQSKNPEVAADLQVLRSNVTKLVEDVRASVADLRNAPGPTLTARILQSTSSLEGNPPVIVDIEERRPPRPAQIGDITSIIAEAARNAHQHSKASRVVVSGVVDRAYGQCSVVDDGIGFDPRHEPEGHYGLVGMRERANKIGVTIKFDSKPGVGTAVRVEWGSR